MTFKCFDCQMDVYASSDNQQGIITTYDYDAALIRHREIECPVWLAIATGEATVTPVQSSYTLEELRDEFGPDEEPVQQVSVETSNRKKIIFRRKGK